MNKFIKKFKEHNDYLTYISNDDYAEPHVSLCSNEGCIQYNLGSKVLVIVNGDGAEVSYNLYNSDRELIVSLNIGESDVITIPQDRILYSEGYFDMYINDVKISYTTELWGTDWGAETMFKYKIPSNTKKIIIRTVVPE